jgi:ATP-dependent Lon protease
VDKREAQSNDSNLKLRTLEGQYELLKDEIKAIHDEITDQSPAQSDLNLLRKRFIESVPAEFDRIFRMDFARLSQLPTFSPDYQRISAHLEFVASLPWTRKAVRPFDLDFCKRQMNKALYDLSEIKEQVLEYLTLYSFRPLSRAPGLVFVGPPGMGKVSLGLTIADCLGRPVERINLAAARGAQFILGENRHQVNGAPGAILRAIQRSETNNPVIILEELDHIDWEGRNNCGVPLIELFDRRNMTFTDEYVGVPFDISQIWFIITANSLDDVPKILRDSLEIIEFSGYIDEIKLNIAKQFLVPASIADTHLKEKEFKIEDAAILKIIRRYTRESGVNQLKQCMQKIVRKVVAEKYESKKAVKAITPDMLFHYLGPEWFFKEESRDPQQVGVATGLVWTRVGGEVIYIETVKLPKGRGLILTGRLGKIMRESAETALSYLWAHAADLQISEDDFVRSGIHIHVPAGSIAKDGPSAGLTILIALASLFLKTPVPADIAMTGEITLTGQIFPVGGIREKVLACHRVGIKRVILPEQNASDLQVLPQNILRELNFIMVRNIHDVLPVVFNIKAPKKPRRSDQPPRQTT